MHSPICTHAYLRTHVDRPVDAVVVMALVSAMPASAGRMRAAYVLPRTTRRSNMMFDTVATPTVSSSRYCERGGADKEGRGSDTGLRQPPGRWGLGGGWGG
eukprot:161165-Chlamydomonas_euryale.AAC.1